MKKELFIVIIEKDNDGSYIAHNTGNDKFLLLGRGDVVADAKKDFVNSMEEIKESIINRGEEVPDAFINEPVFQEKN